MCSDYQHFSPRLRHHNCRLCETWPSWSGLRVDLAWNSPSAPCASLFDRLVLGHHSHGKHRLGFEACQSLRWYLPLRASICTRPDGLLDCWTDGLLNWRTDSLPDWRGTRGATVSASDCLPTTTYDGTAWLRLANLRCEFRLPLLTQKTDHSFFYTLIFYMGFKW